VPTLLSTDLPPCGYIPQIAYGNVVRRLRKVWLERANQHTDNIPLLDICNWVRGGLEAEAEDSPVGKERGTKARRPWRREDVFDYELRWARYFVREVEAFEKRPKMTEAELDKQDFMDKMFPIPKELSLYVKNNLNKKWVLDMWKAWHHKKRGTPTEERVGLGIGGAKEDTEHATGGASDAPERIEDLVK
jgi:hypothetical protein